MNSRTADWAPRDHDEFTTSSLKVFGVAYEEEAIVLVGGGISAGQIALRLVKEKHEVHLVSRHALREHQFDSDPGWLGPKFMNGFNREADFDRRRMMITEARHRGSVPPDVRRALKRSINQGQLSWHQDEVAEVQSTDRGVRVQLANGENIDAQRLLLATGFAPVRPGGDLLDSLIKSASLPCASCGYPIVDESLRWHPGIYVSGPLAELELGPTSRNIAGARRAADRLMAVVRADRVALENPLRRAERVSLGPYTRLTFVITSAHPPHMRDLGSLLRWSQRALCTIFPFGGQWLNWEWLPEPVHTTED